MNMNSECFALCYTTHRDMDFRDTLTVRQFARIAQVSVRTAYRYFEIAPESAKDIWPVKHFVQLLSSDNWS